MGRRKCAFVGCKNTEPDYHLFSFPVSDRSRCSQWIISSGNHNLVDASPEKLKRTYLCEVHFSPRSFSSQKRLFTTANPAYGLDGERIQSERKRPSSPGRLPKQMKGPFDSPRTRRKRLFSPKRSTSRSSPTPSTSDLSATGSSPTPSSCKSRRVLRVKRNKGDRSYTFQYALKRRLIYSPGRRKPRSQKKVRQSPLLKFLLTGEEEESRTTGGEYTQYHSEEHPSTSTAGVSNNAAAFYEKSVASLLESGDEDNAESEQELADEPADVHYTSSKESQKGKIRLNAGSLFPETPTFSLTQELMMDLHEFSDKIQNFYPDVLGKQFTLTFQGEDGDKSEYIFTSASETRRSGERHNSLRCNECDSDIVGFRYKCVSCPDYDLCSACESLGLHADHLMMRIAKPIKLKRARMLLQQWCETMKAAGITTAEEITGGQDDDPESKPQQPSSSTMKSLILETPLRGTSSSKAAKGKATSKGKVKATKKSTPIDEPKKNEAKKRKIEEAPEGDNTILTDAAIKEETIEDFYHSLSETNEANEIEIFIPTEEVKLEDADPLETDKIKSEDIEMDVTSSTTPLGDPEPASMTSEQPGPASMTSEQLGAATMTSERLGPATMVREHPGPSTIPSGHPGPATTASVDPGTPTITSGHPRPATTTSVDPGTPTITSGHPGPATTASVDPGTRTITSGHPGPAKKTSEDPAVRFQTFTHRPK